MNTREPVFFIEDGYLEIGLWVTYKCNVGCPHCYLRALKTKSPDLTFEKYEFLLDSIKRYKKDWKIIRITMYGAEPQMLPPAYYYKLIDMTLEIFPNAEFSVFTSLQTMNNEWLYFFKYISKFSSVSAASYDGLMRGEKYNDKLFKSLSILKENNVKMGMMSVLNRSLVDLGPRHYAEVLDKYNIYGFSIKPFLPIEGQRNNFDKWSVSMDVFSKFAIALHEELDSMGILRKSGMLIDACNSNSILNNIGAYTFFIDGDLRVMYMGYNADREEFLQEFGIISGNSSFGDVVNSTKRNLFLSKQRMLDGRQDCLICEHAGRCLAEVFKKNYDDSEECVGARHFVDWAYKKYGSLNESKV